MIASILLQSFLIQTATVSIRASSFSRGRYLDFLNRWWFGSSSSCSATPFSSTTGIHQSFQRTFNIPSKDSWALPWLLLSDLVFWSSFPEVIWLWEWHRSFGFCLVLVLVQFMANWSQCCCFSRNWVQRLRHVKDQPGWRYSNEWFVDSSECIENSKAVERQSSWCL